MIDIRNLTKRFPTVTALNAISLRIGAGEFFGLLGPNGAGKSTLMNLLVGYLDADEGEILVNGRIVTRDDLETRRMIGLVPQSLALYDEISAVDNLEIFGSFYDVDGKTLHQRIRQLLDAVELYDRRKDKVQTFSGGMKRRLNMIASMLHDPPILLCDEPTVGVDPQSRNAIFEYLQRLNREGKTIIYTTHYMEEVERLCGRIAIIDFGSLIAEGTLDELLERLSYEESVFIVRNASTAANIEQFKQFGTVVEQEDRLELKPDSGFRLSTFFHSLEENGISPRLIELHKPTLEALFLNLTGRRLRD